MELLQAEKTTCSHCGEACDQTISTDGKLFCCYGCRAVDELLTNSDLNSHYQETSIQNKSLSELKAERKYGFLNNEDVLKQLLSFQDEKLSVIKLDLPGIHCSSCIYLLEHLPKLDETILRAEVNFIKRTITVSFSHHEKSLKELVIFLAQLGYPPNISLDSLDKTKKQVHKSNLGVKIAVAGFCFGNAMLMSIPEYLDEKALLTEEFRNLFGWISLTLALPVIFFSGVDYLTKAWKGLKVGNLNIDVPIALGVLTLFGRSLYEIISHTGGGYIDSLAGLIFFLLIGKWYQGKTYQALSFERDYTSYFPISITCIIDGNEFQRSIKELKKGDHIVIHNDELIPADGIILEGSASIDYSFVTGESELVQKESGNKVYAGGRQKGSQLIIAIEKSVNNSELTQLWNNEVFNKDSKSLTLWIDRISHYFTLSIILIAFATGIYWWFANPEIVWQTVSAVLIVACPCALALTIPFAYGHGMRLLGKAGLYMKNAEVIESLSTIEAIVFDKTGTLTSPGSAIVYDGEELTTYDKCLLKSGLGNSAHPLSRIIHDEFHDVKKFPISTFSETTGKGFVSEVRGCSVKVGSADYLNLPKETRTNESSVFIQVGEKRGNFRIKSNYRGGIFTMLQGLKEKFKLHLLSGDNSSELNHLTPYFDELKFGQRPSDKLDFLSEINQKTLMVGDGLNDAGALKKAAVGMAISEDVHQFSPACDAILQSQNILKIPSILQYSKQIIRIVFIAFGLSFLYNLVGLSFAITGHLTPLVSAILMPISSVTVVGFVTLMASWKGKYLNSIAP
ncbi:MAG: heavy metal translocating P-type ATPase metal-binding domain-containing protein [Ekhidna sp.]